MSKKSKLIKAASIFASEDMEVYLSDFPDDTPVRLEVTGRNGYVRTFTLGELRRFWRAFEGWLGKMELA